MSAPVSLRGGFAVAAAVISLLPCVMFAQPANNSASGNATMKAVRLHDFGAPEVLQYEDAPRPQPKGDELLLRVIATAVNPVDAKIRAGGFRLGGAQPQMPIILGYDIAGIVEVAGAKTTKFKKGDAVYGCLAIMRGGGDAEFAVAKEDELSPKPASLSFAEAAALPIAAGTAWQALVEIAKLSEGQSVFLIYDVQQLHPHIANLIVRIKRAGEPFARSVIHCMVIVEISRMRHERNVTTTRLFRLRYGQTNYLHWTQAENHERIISG
jgi:hypothetical protein